MKITLQTDKTDAMLFKIVNLWLITLMILLVQVIAFILNDLVTDLSFNVNESGDIKMLPMYAEPYKNTNKYKNQFSHHLKFFRFNNRTIIPTNKVSFIV